MANVKTAISLQKELFDEAEQLAKQLNIPRSRLFVLALEDYIQRYQSRRLLEQINAAFEDEPDPEEQTYLQQIRRQQRRLVEGEW